MRCLRLADCGRPLSSALSFAAVAALLAGCAASRDSYDYQSQVGVAAAAPTPVVAPPPKTVMEADGLPAQAAPRVRRNPEPDDPTEPFSPNYGPAPEDEPRARPAVKMEEARRGGGLSNAEVQRVMARAIVLEEMRKP